MSELPRITPAWRDQPAGVPWPNDEWPTGPSSPAVDALVAEAFDRDELGTNAVVVVRGGRVIAEGYGGVREHFDRPSEPIDETTPLISWSMAKSMLHLLVGVLVGEGRLDPAASAALPEWADPSDPRHGIRLADLLAMRDGLDFVEDYVDDSVSDVIEMLFGAGRADVAGYAAAKAARHAPGAVYNYSSGTSNIISRIVADVVGRGESYERFIRTRLFEPIGMTTATATFDEAGVFIASSFVHAPAREFAKFGLLHLRGGVWDGRVVVSRDWTATAQVPLSRDEESGAFYSWQWWVLGDPAGTYWANGYQGQMILVVPAHDAVVVRLGRTPAEQYPELRRWRDRMVGALGA
jgi:CubicO group peptidase (beta-lactamase class C family)